MTPDDDSPPEGFGCIRGLALAVPLALSLWGLLLIVTVGHL